MTGFSFSEAGRKCQQGFTLVELAIVMIIIGLLIGGVLKGQQLIENAKVTSTIAQVKGFQAALNSFKDTYAGVPGDMANAQLRLAGCQAGAGNNCVNGDGNGLIDDGAGGDSTWATVTQRTWSNTVQVWKHLALADMITGVEVNAGTGTADLAWGKTHPASSLRGGYELYFDPVTSAGTSGHFLRLSNGGVSGAAINTLGTHPASPLQAANIDRKLDDGKPCTGSMLSNYGVCGGSDGCMTTTAGASNYAEQTAQKNCTLFFMIDG